MGFRDTDRVLAKVDFDEPIFVIRCQDRTSIHTIQKWLEGARESLTPEHVQEVHALIDDFAHWQAVHPERVKQPD